jgi:hypothetical protein
MSGKIKKYEHVGGFEGVVGVSSNYLTPGGHGIAARDPLGLGDLNRLGLLVQSSQ